MNHRPSASARRAASRACWLAEVAAALDTAGGVALRLRERRPADRGEVALLAQITELQREVESTRRGGRFVTYTPLSETDISSL